MIEIIITDDQKQRAKELYDFNALNGSITSGRGNKYGAMGEVLVYDYFKDKYPVDFTSTYDYDMIITGYKVDVKTKHTTVKPKADYLCSISAFNTRQQCDYYIFVRVLKTLETGWILGQTPKDWFFKHSVFKKKGELDVNGWTFKDDCYNIRIDKLGEIKI